MNGIRVSIFALLLSICQAEMIQVVRGHVESDLPFLGTDLTAELDEIGGKAPAQHASVAGDGAFEFRNVSSGRYNLRLTTLRGDTICQQWVEVFSFTGELSIRLPKRAPAHQGAPTVSVRELLRPVPPKAFRAVAEAQRESQAGHDLAAIRKLQRALDLYPDYSDARLNLGVAYIRLGRIAEAREEFEKAIASGPPSALLHANLSYTLFALGRWQEAEQAARRALALDASYGRGHYLLGSILAKSIRPDRLGNAPEAAHHLRLGASDVAHAYLEIAWIYLAEGDRLSAVEELRLYLKSGDTAHRADAEKWLAAISAN
jgi:Tfp pilus assembly protein PilF